MMTIVVPPPPEPIEGHRHKQKLRFVPVKIMNPKCYGEFQDGAGRAFLIMRTHTVKTEGL